MRGEILGLERRRIWHDEDRLEILMPIGVGGTAVTQVAQLHNVTRQQIYARHETSFVYRGLHLKGEIRTIIDSLKWREK